MRTSLALGVLCLALLAGCNGAGDGEDPTPTGTVSPTGTSPTSPGATPISAPSPPATPPDCSAAADGLTATGTLVTLTTSKGCIVVELEDARSPKTVANFLNYTREGFFDGTLFHRIIKDFMVQGGGMDTGGQFKSPTHPPVQNEARSSGLLNEKYTVAMARSGHPDSATNQFFINHADNGFLDPGPDASNPGQAGYTVFGKVVAGTDVVDAIASVPVRMYQANQGWHCQGGDRQPSCPREDVVIHRIALAEA